MFHILIGKAHTCDSEREDIALRGEVMVVNIDVIGTAVVSLVAVVGCRKPDVSKAEVVGVIDSRLGVGV